MRSNIVRRELLVSSLMLLLACAGDGEPSDTGTSDVADTDTEGVTYAALVRGELFTDDLDAAGDAHDALAGGGQAAAQAAGDIAHDALTGAGILGTAPEQFLGVDRWNNADNMVAFYSDPTFAAAFATLFSGPPALELFAQSDWHGWGSLESGDGGEYWFVVARGHLAEADPAAAQAAHDAVASYGEPAVTAAGDVAHVVFLGLEDPREFLAIDVWTDGTAIEGVYTDPSFAAAFGALFDDTPSVAVYHSTDWVQW